ncbi:MAG: site-specific DNA-methyltransferase [Bacillus sp. (in: Bacteria)]|nr:site-specific DNA-methyltransferase [Bacillus sp. (in: firmicutes)]
MDVKALLGEKIFDFPKPVQLIKRCIQISKAGENEIVLDFFSGSGTTAHAVMELNVEEGANRKYIMVQLPEKLNETSVAYKKGFRTICDVGRKRIEKAGELLEKKKRPGQLLDTGFKVFRLT